MVLLFLRCGVIAQRVAESVSSNVFVLNDFNLLSRLPIVLVLYLCDASCFYAITRQPFRGFNFPLVDFVTDSPSTIVLQCGENKSMIHILYMSYVAVMLPSLKSIFCFAMNLLGSSLFNWLLPSACEY